MKLNTDVRHLVSSFKTVAIAGAIFLILHATGLLGSLSYYSQSAVMSTGLFDAKDKPKADKVSFDYQFQIKDLAGNRKSFAQYKNKVVFLNLWATWCGPCRAEMPTIEKLYQSVDTSKVAFVMLSIDRDRDKPKIVSYVNDKKFTFPVYQPSGSLPELLQVPSIPTTFIIAKDGRVASQEVGTTNFNTPRFKKYLQKLTEE